MIPALVIASILLLLGLVVLCLRIIREYERAIVFRLGRLRGPLGPGVLFVLPFLDKMVRVDLRVVTLTIPPQEVITKDNVTARVNAVVLFRVVDPVRSVMAVENHAVATSQIAQTSLRSVVGRAELDTLLAHRADLNEDLTHTLAQATEPWGVEAQVVEIKDVEIPEIMQRAMAREAEAERERRAKVISARGELQASTELRDAAITLSESPASLQLRYLQTLLELGADQNSTVVFPIPLDIVTPFLEAAGGRARGSASGTESRSDEPATGDTPHRTLTWRGPSGQDPEHDKEEAG
ncbi:slipin family protein [Ornithinimicrobium ciconiae]|uniref:Slipin family protein n=1 Tax=Ornithinimicrobium ciconiae TaxID=2594265 RepID=A0A516GBL9_9MICO|nr:SPFH domain-containing protein [Ornithinimicrobium ciconiae]QDO88916.1 slipin family protein [Ornithinimicrobium ciconiae]